jgi:hypothetical protein
MCANAASLMREAARTDAVTWRVAICAILFHGEYIDFLNQGMFVG